MFDHIIKSAKFSVRSSSRPNFRSYHKVDQIFDHIIKSAKVFKTDCVPSFRAWVENVDPCSRAFAPTERFQHWPSFSLIDWKRGSFQNTFHRNERARKKVKRARAKKLTSARKKTCASAFSWFQSIGPTEEAFFSPRKVLVSKKGF